MRFTGLGIGLMGLVVPASPQVTPLCLAMMSKLQLSFSLVIDGATSPF
jgi:hypothetical protein